MLDLLVTVVALVGLFVYVVYTVDPARVKRWFR